ncbi:TonB-dependent receptor [Qipengyuania sp. ASV99]|uniref:TonB-dependent receptor n=1 Tax=Qipengyuania sp. ASV99 TaxID=3399681 RepID=UPI003A4C5F04
MISIVSRIAVAAALCGVGAAYPALAQSGAGAAPANEQPSENQAQAEEDVLDDPHYRGEILVSADALEELDFIAGQDIIDLAAIQRDLSGQLGDILTKVPGVSASSFSPGASRPILRGLDGERVLVLIDGLGTADVGNTSADHATTIDPLTTERIEVLRGPAALLFGSQAIGGVVNVIDRRIPIAVPENGFHVDALTAFDTASNLRSGGASVDAALNDMFVVHLDGSFRETDNLEIPGFQLAPGLRSDVLAVAAEEEAEGEFEEAEEFREAANQRGFLPNSATESWAVNGGLGVILGESSFGASVGYFDTAYGLVGRPAAEHHHGEEGGEQGGEEEDENVSIGLEQWRADLRGDIALGSGFFSRLKLRGGYSDYTHTEFEGTEVGTVFDTQTYEARAELVQRGGGVIGAQYTSRDFQAVGEEAFVAPNETTRLAFFTAQEFDLGGVQIEGAARYETVDVESQPLGLQRDFDLFSGALSVILESSGGTRFGLTASRSERAPAGEELFANGPHIATQSFEIGNPDLGIESAWGIETFVRTNAGPIAFNASVYYQSFSDFIFLSPTGEEQDDLPVFTFTQDDARFFGFEAGFEAPIVEADSYTVSADLRASYVSAELDDGSSLPRIPPVNLLAALDADVDAFTIRGEVQWFGEQDEIADFETATDSFTFVNLFLSWRPIPDNRNVVLQLAGENLFDTEGRRHASFTKDFVPLTGRNIRASLRLSF